MGLALAWGRLRGPWSAPGPGSHDGAPPVPLTGGHGLGCGLIVGVGVMDRLLSTGPLPGAVMVVGALFLALGILDDLHRPPPGFRLVVEAAVAIGAAFCFVPALGDGSVVVTVLWILFVVNGMNFLDGSDGAAASAAMGSLLVVGLIGCAASVMTGGICVGILIPFLALNCARPSRIQLGDGGSRMLGAILAVLTLPHIYGMRWVAAVGIVMLPLVEVGSTVVRRLLARRPLFVGDRKHLADRLLDRGWSPRQVAATAFFVSFVTGVVCGWAG